MKGSRQAVVTLRSGVETVIRSAIELQMHNNDVRARIESGSLSVCRGIRLMWENEQRLAWWENQSSATRVAFNKLFPLPELDRET